MQVTLGYVFGQCFPNWQQVYKCQLHFHCKSSAPGVLCLVFGPCPSTAEVETKPPPRGVIPFFLFTSLSSQKLSILPSRCLNMRHSIHLTSPARAKRADNLILFFRVYWMNSNWHRFTSSRKFTYRMPWHLRQRQPFFWSQKQKKKKFYHQQQQKYLSRLNCRPSTRRAPFRLWHYLSLTMLHRHWVCMVRILVHQGNKVFSQMVVPTYLANNT